MKRTPSKIPRISTRGYYDLLTGKTLKTKSYYLYPRKSFEKFYGKQEIAIMIHGLQNNKTDAVAKFEIARRRLKKLGYLYPVIGYSYDANTKGAHIKKSALKALRAGQRIAKQNGKNLSKFIIDFKKKSPKTKIRLIGHSLGTEVILGTIQKLARSNYSASIESVHFFGSSLPSNIANNRNGKIFQKTVTKKIKNYYCPSDEVLRYSHEEGAVINPLGLFGATGKSVPKFSQKRVYPKNHRFASYAAALKSFP